jgi:hypothetical protein
MTTAFIRGLYKDYLKLGMKIWREEDGYYLMTLSLFLQSVPPYKLMGDNHWVKIMAPYIIGKKGN